ncbi:hypothetical protein MAPG_07114, partial [Magnaporthiopsis poae ATCC 64411]
DEVTESPVGAPGSGHRRRVRISAAASQTASVSLQEVLLAEPEPEHIASSSPLERKTRRARSSLGTASTRLSSNAAIVSTNITAAAATSSVSSTRLSARLSQASSAVRSAEVEESSPHVASNPDQTPALNVTHVDNVDELSPDDPTGASSAIQSSPAARALKKRRASAGLAAKRAMLRKGRQTARSSSVDMDIDELSPRQPDASDKPSERRSQSTRESLVLAEIPEEDDEVEEAQPPPSRAEPPSQAGGPNGESQDEAEEVDDQEAARTLGRKRLRRSFPAPSPELGSAAEETVARPPKRQRGAPASSPTRQNQPSRRQRMAAQKDVSKQKMAAKQKEPPKQTLPPKQKEAPSKQKGPPKQRAKKKTAPPPQDSGPEVEVSGEPISVPV